MSHITAPNQVRNQLFGNCNIGQVALSATSYLGQSGLITTAEATARIALSQAATIKFLYIRTSSTQTGTGSLVFTVLKNGSPTTVTITVAAGEAAGLKSDITHSFTVVAGDELTLQAQNNGTATGAQISGWSLGVYGTPYI